jgi:hypothetical protein
MRDKRETYHKCMAAFPAQCSRASHAADAQVRCIQQVRRKYQGMSLIAEQVYGS